MSVSAIITPLPSARPSALITIGAWCSSIYALAFAASSKTSYFAVGMLKFLIRSFENALLPSIIAALLLGPKHGIPFPSSSSTMPSTSGSSGATIAKSIFSLMAKSLTASISVALMSTHTASFAMPPFPGRA